ncbi:MAG: CPBP family intramembrane glutamic endopeptidase [bacterium]
MGYEENEKRYEENGNNEEYEEIDNNAGNENDVDIDKSTNDISNEKKIDKQKNKNNDENDGNQENNENEAKQAFPGRLQAVGLTLVTILMLLVVGSLITIALLLFGIDINTEVQYLPIVNALIEIIAIGGVILYIMRDKGFNWGYIKGKNVKSISFYYKVTILMVGLSIVISDLDNLIQQFIPMSEMFSDAFQNLLNQNILMVFFALCIVAPLFEETFFRGLVLRGLLKNLEHWTAIFFSAFLFGIIHMNIWQGIGTFFIGIAIGWVFYKTRSLYAVIFAHFINNFLVLIAVKSVKIPGFSAPSETGFQPVWFTIMGVLLLIIGILLIEREDIEIESST